VKINGIPTRTIWLASDGWAVEILDQTRLPFDLVVLRLETMADFEVAIRDMQVRGAPLIGATAAYGMAAAMRIDPTDVGLQDSYQRLMVTRPTAVNLRWALDDLRTLLTPLAPADRQAAAYARAAAIADADVRDNQALGAHGAKILRDLWLKKGGKEPLNVLTHCNAGWLATVDWGTALGPVYTAFEEGLPIHVWVDETRPRNQGASLTACELNWHGVPHTVIVDNAGGHLMQHGLVDVCIVGSDRTTASGDVCNKIGTYLKALAAHDNGIPFYAAVPSSTIDWTIHDGVRDIPIEERSAREVTHITGRAEDGRRMTVQLTPDGSPARNDAFDVTPARLVTGIITERGVSAASADGLKALFNR
jgi:methylthioribose-1-phosphate isomerase